jgi:hypothetical protein
VLPIEKMGKFIPLILLCQTFHIHVLVNPALHESVQDSEQTGNSGAIMKKEN